MIPEALMVQRKPKDPELKPEPKKEVSAQAEAQSKVRLEETKATQP